MLAARDDDAEVRHVAISAIGQIGGRGAVRALERLAADAERPTSNSFNPRSMT